MERERKYSLQECERRFILASLPLDLPDPVRVLDDYIEGTRLRLRRIESLDGHVLQRKLGHKVRPDPLSARVVLHTSMYLEAVEYAALATLPSDRLIKLRYAVAKNVGVDLHEHPREGLIVLEVDLGSETAAEAYDPDFEFERDVTDDDRFTGRELARPIA